MPGTVRGFALALLVISVIVWLGGRAGGGHFAGAGFLDFASNDLFSPWSDKKAGTLIDVPCMFSLPSGVNGACYRFVVPQDWFVDDGRKLGLAVAVVQPTGRVPDAPPVVYLEGGPGGPAMPEAAAFGSENNWITEDFEPVFDAGRPLVLLDGRGVGASLPFLSCPGAMKRVWREFRLLPAKRSLTAYLSDVEDCLARLSAQGVDFSAYDSAQSAQDLKHLRAALGYEQWALYGVSYGARTALAAMSADGLGMERVIFDSPSYGRGHVWNQDQDAFDRVITVLDAACRAGEICPDSWGSLNTRLRMVFDQLNEAPLRIRRSGGFWPVYMDGHLALYGIHLLLYYDVGPQILWSVLEDLEGGDEARAQFLLDLVYGQYEPSGFSEVVNWATYCQESDVYSPYTRISELPVYETQDVTAFRSVCGFMGLRYSPSGAVSDEAGVFGDIPTIVVSGSWDPITPPSYGAALARDLGAVAHIVRPRAAHGAAFRHEDACAQEVLTAFLRSTDGMALPSCAQ